jgi:YegS/Rv2252/BmrU family lipid kinase
MTKSITFIINPASGFGKTKKLIKPLIKEIRSQKSDAKIHLTQHALHAISLTKSAIKNGSERIVVIGGDGTLNEVVNGFFDQHGNLHSSDVSIAMVPSGTGSDFCRSIESPKNIQQAIDIAINGKSRPCDVGLVEAHDAHGQKIKRHFINVSSLGISGLVAGLMRHITRRFGPTAAYFLSTAQAISAFDAPTIVVTDSSGSEQTINKCSLLSFANGRFYGSGMKIAPHARLDDGLFDVVAISDLSLLFFLMHGYKVYQGKHLDLPSVSVSQASICHVRSLSPTPVYIETDGELFAELPATYSMRHNILSVVR